MYGRILVPIDGSETSMKGLEEAIKLARQLNAGVRLIHVLDRKGLIGRDAPAATATHVADSNAAANAILDAGMARVRGAGVDVDSVLVEARGGPAGKYIVENAMGCEADLIVCGTHGRRGLERALMGSDAEYIVRHAPVPVLLVRAQMAGCG